MQRCLLIPLITLYSAIRECTLQFGSGGKKKQAANPHARYVGKYEMDGNIIQFALQNDPWF